ncbi:ABC transporter substrate-binding protein [Cohnella fermenti]|nr:extracellular solute-binding protein [Cohnella fermenti]
MSTVMSVLLLAGCGNGNGNDTVGEGAVSPSASASASESAAAPVEPVTLNIFSSSVETAEAFNLLKKDYEATHPGVTLEIASQVTDTYYTSLKTKFAAKEMPDLFAMTGFNGMSTWVEHLEDLSNEPWVSDMVDTAKPGATFDGKLYGFPMSVMGTGYLYNKDLFAKAGIDKAPSTLTELKDAVEKLKVAGITPFVVPYGSWYNPGNFSAENPMSKQAEPDQFMADLTNGTAKFSDNAVYQDWLNNVELELANAYGNPLTVDYNGQITAFATGQGAMTTGCNCSQLLIDEITPNMNIGIMPMPINDDAELNGKISTEVPGYWVISKDSEVKEQAKEFLKWFSTDGAHYISDEFKFVPAFKSMAVDPAKLGALGTDLKTYVDEGKMLTGTKAKFPDGVTADFGASLQKLASGKIDKAQMLEEFQTAWEKASKK